MLEKKQSRRTAKHHSTDSSILEHVEIAGIFLFALAVFMFCALLGLNVGSFGAFVSRVLKYALGRAAWVLPLYLMVIGLGYIIKHERLTLSKKFFSILLILVSLIGLLHYFLVPEGEELIPTYLPTGGGLLGGVIVFVLKKIVGRVGALIILLAGTLAGIVLTGKFSLSTSLKKAGNGVKTGTLTAVQKFEDVRQKHKERHSFYNQEKDDDSSKAYTDYLEENPKDLVQPILKFSKEAIEEKSTSFPFTKPAEKSKEKTVEYKPVLPPHRKPGDTSYVFPPFNLLHSPVKTDKQSSKEEIRRQSATIEQTLVDFGVRATLINVTKGPSVTRFELAPAPGVKVNKIQNLADDIALKLAVSSVRIEPIPGKAAIGLEVPSKTTEPVIFRSIVDCEAVRNAKGKLCVGLGKDISGNVIVADLSKMPHLLVAGSTGSGKSVCIIPLLPACFIGQLLKK